MKFLLCIFLSFVCWLTQASPLPDFPFVTVEGSAMREVKPDIASVRFEIESFAKDSESASEQLHSVTDKVIKTLVGLGIKEDSITSYEIDKQTQRKRDDDYNTLEILGYEFNREFVVQVNNLEHYSALVEQLTEIDNVHGFATEFDTSERDEIVKALIAEAAEDARSRASMMAAGLGVKLDSVFAFNDSGSFENAFATFGLSGQNRVFGMAVMRSRSSDMFMPKYIEVHKTINVVYKIK